MKEEKTAPKRFIGRFVIGDAITITIEYEYAKMIRHLRNRAIVRAFRSADKQAGKITFEQERDELARKLVVMEHGITEDTFLEKSEINVRWATSGLNKEVNKIIANRVLPDEKETYPKLMEQRAMERMEPLVRMNLVLEVTALLLQSLDDAVISGLGHQPIKAAEYDKHSRRPRIGVVRATRQIKNSTLPKHTSNVYIKLGEQYDRILKVVDAGNGIIGLATAVRDSGLYASRYKTIGDAYRDQGVEVPQETIDWILDSAASKRMPTNGAVALELAARETIRGYAPRGLSTNTLKQYLRRSDKLRGVKRKKKTESS